MKHHTLALAALLAAVALAGCSGESEEKLIASARSYLDQRDTKSAVIQLKNALQKNPESAVARLLLGRALLDSGDPRGALEELRRAQERGVPVEQAAPEVARALLMVGEAAKVTTQFAATELREPKAAADLATSVGAAYAMQGDDARTQEYAERALKAQPGFAGALVLQAQLKASQRDFDGALQLLDGVLSGDKTHHGAGALKGTLLWQAKRDLDGALAAFRAVLAAHPGSVSTRSAVIALLREQGKREASANELAELKKVAPVHPETQYLEARAAFEARDYRGALDLVSRVLKVAPDNVAALELAGGAAYQARAYAQAEAHLSRAIQRNPTRTLPRQLLAQTYLRSGQAARAIDTLQPLISGASPDGPSLAVAGEAYLQAGDVAKADDAFKRAAKAAPDDAQVRTSAAIAMAARGRLAEALPELEALAAAGSSPRPDMALISARLAQRDFAGALKAVEGLRTKLPDSAMPDFLRGRVLQQQGDVAGASAAFETAQSKDAAHYPSAAALSAIDFAAGRTDPARQRFTALLKANPKSHLAHLALAEIASRTRAAPADVQRHITDAVQAAPEEALPRVQLVNHLLRQGDAKAALVAAQEASATVPDVAEVIDALGRAQMAAGDSQQALLTFRKLAASQPNSAQLMLRLAEAQFAAKDASAARASLRRALELEPRLFAAQRALATLAMSEKKPDEALALARAWQVSQPKDAAGFALEGEIQASRKDWPAAAAALRAAAARQPGVEIAIALHGVLVNGGQRAEAERWAAEWQRTHPKDAAFRFHLGDVALAGKDVAGAEAHYRAVLEWQPNNALAMNNLAWLMARDGRPGAVAMAERAAQLMPDRAAILDTLAAALVAEKQLPRALEVQKQALQRAPQDAAMRLNLARIYLQAGDKQQARNELQTLAKLGDTFRGQPEVAELLKATQ
jgi:putative PEP-CTERM system TPR-repeat lipoprotein